MMFRQGYIQSCLTPIGMMQASIDLLNQYGKASLATALN